MDVSSVGVKAAAVIGLLGMLLLTGCGSTKIYTPDKTVEYQGSIYNVSDVKQLSTRMEGVPGSGNAVDLKGYDRKSFDALVKERGPLTVRTIIALDEKDVVYEQKKVEKGRDFERMQESLQDAYKDLTRFMADGNKTQLKL